MATATTPPTVAVVTITMNTSACFSREFLFHVWTRAMGEERWAVKDFKTNPGWQLCLVVTRCWDVHALPWPPSLSAEPLPLRPSLGDVSHVFSASHLHLLNRMAELIQRKSLSLHPFCGPSPQLTISPVSPWCLSTQGPLFNIYQELRRLTVSQYLHMSIYLVGSCELYQIGAISEPDWEAKCNLPNYNSLGTWISDTSILFWIGTMCSRSKESDSIFMSLYFT